MIIMRGYNWGVKINSKRPRRFTEMERAQLLDAYAQSSMTQREFAALHGIGLSTLTKWRRDNRPSRISKKQDHHFIEVSDHGSLVDNTKARITLESPSGWSIHLPQQTDIQFIQQLMESCSR